MARYRTWDVVIVPLPAATMKETKFRPAVVVSTDIMNHRTGHCLLAMITSASGKPQVGDIPITDLPSAGLPAPSVVRSHKLAVLPEQDLHRQIGTLTQTDRMKLVRQLKEFIAMTA